MKISSEFGAACAVLNLDYRTVAEITQVRPDTARSWISGRRNPPPAVWDDLAVLYQAERERSGGGQITAEIMIARALRRLRAGVTAQNSDRNRRGLRHAAPRDDEIEAMAGSFNLTTGKLG